jgi:RNA polymerase sigma-70 factor (ECF subfamily)
MMPQSTYSPGPQAEGVTCAEADLIALLRAGDEAAIAQLVDQWSPSMFRVARSFVDSPQSAEDVVQDAWLGMLSGLAKFEGRSSLRTWTFSILINRARTRGAREARTLPQSPLAARDESAAGDWLAGPAGEPARTWSSIDVASRWDTAPESVVLSRETLLELDRATSALPPRQRQVVTMRDVCGMSTVEVCAALNISPANQRVLLHRARAVLREALAGYYCG